MKVSPVRALVFIAVCCTFGHARQQLSQKEPPFRPVADVQQIMKAIVDPLTRTVFASVGTIVSVDGIKDIAPATDKEWEAVGAAAVGLAEAGNLLLFESRTKGKPASWITMAQQLIDRSVRAANAAKAKDAEQLLMAGGDLYEICESCHVQYMNYDAWLEWRSKETPCSTMLSNLLTDRSLCN